MTKFKNIKEEISIFHIKEDTFIKVLIYDETTNAVNVDIYYKVNNKYKSITQTELPKEIVTHIATKPSEKISEDELKEFKAFLDKTKITETNTKIENVQTIFGKSLYTNYMITKNKDQDYYILQNAIINEFGMLISTTPIISSIIPYIFADIINMWNKFKKQIFLIDKNIFVQMCELNGKNLGIIYQFEEDENTQEASITVIGIFGIEKNQNGEYIIQTTPEQLNHIKNLQKILDEQTNIFVKKLSLQRKS